MIENKELSDFEKANMIDMNIIGLAVMRIYIRSINELFRPLIEGAKILDEGLKILLDL